MEQDEKKRGECRMSDVRICMAIGAFGSGTLASVFGGWDKDLEILLIFVALDYVTGVIVTIKARRLNSEVGFNGIMRKDCIFLVIVVATQLDRIIGNDTYLYCTTVCMFFIANEGLSILENVGKIGVKLPRYIVNALEKLKGSQTKLSDSDLNDSVVCLLASPWRDSRTDMG